MNDNIFKNRCAQILKGKTLSLPSCAKVNLFLYITGVREDGYHLIHSLFVPVSLFDILTVRLLSRNILNVNCDEDWFDRSDNSLLKAYKLFCNHTNFKIGLNVKLIKNIPIGSGLGGASSNAALLLKLLNTLMELKIGKKLDKRELIKIGAKVGADVPFFIKGRPAIIEGIGERIKEVRIKDELYLVVIYPSIPFYTKEMYKQYDKLNRLTKFIKGDKHSAPFLGYDYIVSLVFNAFESVLRGERRRIVMKLKSSLIKYGAKAASLSGSGSAVFGLFRDASDACFAYGKMLEDFPEYKIFSVKVLRGNFR